MSEQAQGPLQELPPIVQLRRCEACGAACELDKNVCWMCMSKLTGDNPYAPASSELVVGAELDASSRYDSIFVVLLIACMVVATLVAVGIAAEEPGMLWAYGILVGPAFLVTGARALIQIGQTGNVKPKSLFISLTASFAITAGAVVLLVMAAVVLLFLICLQSISRV